MICWMSSRLDALSLELSLPFQTAPTWALRKKILKREATDSTSNRQSGKSARVNKHFAHRQDGSVEVRFIFSAHSPRGKSRVQHEYQNNGSLLFKNSLE